MQAHTVLFVDDEPNILRAIQRILRNENMTVLTATSAEEALNLLSHTEVHAVISDQDMPGANGVELLSRVRDHHPAIIRMMLTGFTAMDVAVDAINRGEIFRLITKPWNDEELKTILRQAYDHYDLKQEIRRLNQVTRSQNFSLQDMNKSLEAKVRERTRQLDEKNHELKTAYIQTIRALAEAIDAKDSYTRGHSERVAVYASRIARKMKLDTPLIERVYFAGLLHDVGKIGIPDAIITKPDRLSDEEYEEIKKHPEIGAKILEPVEFLRQIVPCVRHHHEWFDGSDRGYPERLISHSIPLPSRIILVADTAEAMTSDRPYRKGLPLNRVTSELRKFSGSQFDPVVVDAFLELLEKEGESFLSKSQKFDIYEFIEG
ncbi:MAG TPA: response regulator [Myxococcales bacterium]|jgi:putative nucleotidyltransferase with HDIG domain|nr:response regulator [Myxococcales bacterium]HIL00945.1 response regulator [Myxococcales bacterium]